MWICVGFWWLSGVTFSQGDRTIDLDATQNTRQLGGMVTFHNGIVKQNVLIRSDNLHWLSARDCDRLMALGLKTVVDVRSLEEVEAWPDADCIRGAVRYLHIPMSTFGREPTMVDAYLHLFRNSSASIREFFGVLADVENLPLLYHCQLGKDRAGILSALILRLLNVPDSAIVEDYLLSRQTGYGAEADWIQAILREVDSYGGIDAYLLSIGVSAEAIQAVKDNLLQIPSSVPIWSYK